MIDKSLKQLFLAGHVEGVSYLLLLFVAMPLREFANMPKAVSLAGMIHGILFVWLMYAIFIGYLNKKLSSKMSILLLIASCVPFASFFFERIVLGPKG